MCVRGRDIFPIPVLGGKKGHRNPCRVEGHFFDGIGKVFNALKYLENSGNPHDFYNFRVSNVGSLPPVQKPLKNSVSCENEWGQPAYADVLMYFYFSRNC